MFSGSYVALVTPFTKDLEGLDFAALTRLVAWQIDQGSEGILVAGSTGEGFSLTPQEQGALVKKAVEIAQKRVPILAGASALTTAGAVALAQQGADAGADGLLVVAPPYLKPTQAGIYEHFKAVAAATALPVVIYDNPGRAGIRIAPQTLAKLALLPGLVGVKDSTNDLTQPLALEEALAEIQAPPLCQLSGEDATVPAFLAQGGQGSISALANLVPDLCARLHRCWRAGQISQVTALQKRLFPLIQHVFSETSVACLKAGLAEKGLCHPGVRAPIQPLSVPGRETLIQLMQGIAALTQTQEGDALAQEGSARC